MFNLKPKKQNREILVPKNILIVEDDLDLSNLFKSYIQSADFNVFTLYTGEKIVETVIENHVSLIFLDINMPVKDGIKSLKELKANPQTKDIPVIMLTNHGEIEYMERCLNLGAADYVIKVNIDIEGIKKLASKHLIHLNARYNTEVKEK